MGLPLFDAMRAAFLRHFRHASTLNCGVQKALCTSSVSERDNTAHCSSWFIIDRVHFTCLIHRVFMSSAKNLDAIFWLP